MDKLDKQILSCLYKDAQMPFREISKKVGISSYSIRLRYKKMRKKGIIRYSFMGIDLSKIGYQGIAYLFITLFPNRDKILIVSEIFKIRNVYSVIELIGPFDLMVRAPITDVNSIRKIIYKIKKLPDVQRVEITILKDTSFPINPMYGKILSEKILE